MCVQHAEWLLVWTWAYFPWCSSPHTWIASASWQCDVVFESGVSPHLSCPPNKQPVQCYERGGIFLGCCGCVRMHTCVCTVGECVRACVCVRDKEREREIQNSLLQETPWEKERECSVQHGYCVLKPTVGGCLHCPRRLLLYVLYQNITIECWPACLYSFNKGDFLSDLYEGWSLC